jgi:hypothetical protein
MVFCSFETAKHDKLEFIAFNTLMNNKHRIGPGFILKIIGLLIIFCTAVYSMYFLNTRGIEKTPMAEVFGLNQQEEWRVCSKDLLSFSMDTENPKTSWKILKAQNNWRLLFNGSSEVLNPEQLKTCLQKICSLKVSKIEQKEFVNFQETLSYQFADMTSLIIRLNTAEKTLFWEGNLYQANNLIDFLAEVPRHHCK